MNHLVFEMRRSWNFVGKTSVIHVGNMKSFLDTISQALNSQSNTKHLVNSVVYSLIVIVEKFIFEVLELANLDLNPSLLAR